MLILEGFIHKHELHRLFPITLFPWTDSISFKSKRIHINMVPCLSKIPQIMIHILHEVVEG